MLKENYLIKLMVLFFCFYLSDVAFFSLDAKASYSNEIQMLLTAKDVPWWKDPRTATSEEHAEMNQCRLEHDIYFKTLKDLGFYIRNFQNSHKMSASMFVEDPGLVLGFKNGRYHVVINRVGSAWRTNEGDNLKRYLESPLFGFDVKIYDMREVNHATLDGGDVLRIENHLFIGLSPHTNEKGAKYLAGVAKEFGLIPHILSVPKGLHLKSSCSLGAEGLILYDPELASEKLLALFLKVLPDHQIRPVEHLGSNVLYLGIAPKTGRKTVLVSSRALDTANMLKNEFGLDVIILDRPCHESLSGRLTCSSLRFPLPTLGSWST